MALAGKKYLVEKKYGEGKWSYVGENDKSFEIAQKINHSPSLTNTFIKNMTRTGWNNIKTRNNEWYRIAKVN